MITGPGFEGSLNHGETQMGWSLQIDHQSMTGPPKRHVGHGTEELSQRATLGGWQFSS